MRGSVAGGSGGPPRARDLVTGRPGQQLWDEVDAHLTELLAPADPAMEAGLAAAMEAGLPSIQVSPPLGKLLHLLVRLTGARRVLEIGTLGGYSTTWLARALPEGGSVVTLESVPLHAEVARATLALAGLADVVDVRLGRALDLLPELDGPFDLVFVDADKSSVPDYLEHSLRVTAPGSVIVVDNVVRDGAVADAASTDPSVVGVRRMLEMVAAEPRLDATALQTVGNKGYDGFLLALVV